ncbi:carbohydrate ABC transporter permease [Vallitalea guaymasensis]|uniref:carbohydrate ABC transporter permease n=1 Tax=Vallitalea guaymasensis TaxID=1185412 RepID=UPI000DE3D0C1|nr:sugar ABC transporter permease [Vallitalea guaymasensis]
MRGNKRSRNIIIVLFLLPALIFLVVFMFYPFIMNFINSFYKSDGFLESTFIGLDNYRRLLKDDTIKIAVKNTYEIMLYVCLFEVGIAIILACMVDSITKGQKFFRTVYFFPIVISATAIGMMFKLVYSYDVGLLNSIMEALGQERRNWITVKSAVKMVSIPIVWQYIGFYFIIILTAIKQIPKELYESAYLDGINGFTKTIYITLPLIRNVIITCLILAINGVLKVFDMVLVITEGGPLNKSQILGLYMYKKAFADNTFGYAATISVLIVVLGLLTIFIVNKIFKKDTITY